MKRLTFFLGLSLLLTISSAQAEDNPTLTILNVKGTSGIVEIHYRVEDATGDRLVTTDWQFSVDDGATWMNIDEAAIGNNDPKPPREDFISFTVENERIGRGRSCTCSEGDRKPLRWNRIISKCK